MDEMPMTTSQCILRSNSSSDKIKWKFEHNLRYENAYVWFETFKKILKLRYAWINVWKICNWR